MTASVNSLPPNVQKVYECICRAKAENRGDSPTIREIADGCGITSTSVVNYHLDTLEKAGLIKRPRRGRSRRIEVVGGSWLPPTPLQRED